MGNKCVWVVKTKGFRKSQAVLTTSSKTKIKLHTEDVGPII